mgnify:CR=1 FL=1
MRRDFSLPEDVVVANFDNPVAPRLVPVVEDITMLGSPEEVVEVFSQLLPENVYAEVTSLLAADGELVEIVEPGQVWTVHNDGAGFKIIRNVDSLQPLG